MTDGTEEQRSRTRWVACQVLGCFLFARQRMNRLPATALDLRSLVLRLSFRSPTFATGDLMEKSPPLAGLASEPAALKSDQNYLKTLDGWRALAIVLVLVAHGADGLQRAGIARFGLHAADLKHIGLFGVRIFFGLSGLLITSRLLQEEGKRGRISVGNFYVRRFFRILPPAFAYLTFAGALAAVGILPITFGRWLSALFCFANYSPAPSSWFVGHFWSLAVEEHFYLLWPTAFLLLGIFQRRVAVVVGGAMLLALWRAVDYKFHITHSTPAQFWGRTDIQGDSLLWGVFFALAIGSALWHGRLRHWLKPGWVRLGLLLALLTLGLYRPHGWKLSMCLLTVQAIVIPLVLLGTMFEPERNLGRLLESAPFRWLGRLSYSVYLWQQMFLVWDEDRIPALARLESWPLNLSALLVCATLSHYLVEKPLIATGHRLVKRMAARSTKRVQMLAPENR
jgi:peptidoglycan/LPS O-acetylase OafA/YrhL